MDRAPHHPLALSLLNEVSDGTGFEKIFSRYASLIGDRHAHDRRLSLSLMTIASELVTRNLQALAQHFISLSKIGLRDFEQDRAFAASHKAAHSSSQQLLVRPTKPGVHARKR